MLLQVAAPRRRRHANAALKSTYTASVSAVEASTPTATRGSSLIIFLHCFRSRHFLLHRETHIPPGKHPCRIAELSRRQPPLPIPFKGLAAGSAAFLVERDLRRPIQAAWLGLMLWFMRKKLVGSYLFFSVARRP